MAVKLIRFGMAFFALTLGMATTDNGSAKPLTSKACVRLVDEHDALTRGGIEKILARDPASVPGKIKAERLTRIERFLVVESQIRFRCPAVKLPELKITPPSAPSKAQAAKMDKKRGKVRGRAIPLPNRKPARYSKRAG